MPGTQEIILLLVALFVLWLVLKLAKIAIKVTLLFVTIAVIAGVLWYLFMR